MIPRSPRRLKKLGLVVSLAIGSLHIGTCAHNENFFEFRATAGPGLESGVQALLDGDADAFNTMLDSVVEGLFEMFAPDTAEGRPHR